MGGRCRGAGRVTRLRFQFGIITLLSTAGSPVGDWAEGEIVNNKANGLGRPLPKGVVRLYAPDPDGVQTFVAKTTIDHTPVDEKIRLLWGYAFDIACSRKQTAQRRRGDEHEAAVEYSLRNHKDYDVTVTVIARVPRTTFEASCERPWHIREVGVVEIPVLLKAGADERVTFRYRYNTVRGGGLVSPHDR